MSDRDDLSLEAVERRLADRANVAAPPGHRDRVLAAVRDALAENENKKVPATNGTVVPATRSGRSPHGNEPVSRDVVAGTGIDGGGRAALVTIALSAALVIVAPWVGTTRSAAPLPAEPRLVAQARAAGIDLPAAAVAATGGTPRESPARAGADDVFNARRVEAWRLRNLLEGEL